MNNKKPFSHPRWNDIPEAKVIGHRKSSKEEREEAKKIMEEFLKQTGQLKEDESLEEAIKSGKAKDL